MKKRRIKDKPSHTMGKVANNELSYNVQQTQPPFAGPENSYQGVSFFSYQHISQRAVQLIAQFRICPSYESRHCFVANYTSVVIFEKRVLVCVCCIIIPLYVCESKY